MNDKPVEPLSAEERELAALLGRTGPHGEPSPALDAKILAAAHAAVARDAARAPARRRRWPALAGLAASVLIAAGIGWQLLPRHQASMQVGEAPATAMATGDAEAPGTADAAAPAAASQVAEAPLPSPAPQLFKSSPLPVKQLARPKAAPPAELARERRSEALPADVAEPRPTDIVSSPAAPPPPPPPPPSPPAPPAPAAIVMEPAPRAFAPAAASAPAAERKQAYATEAAAPPAPASDTGAETKAAANDNATLDSVVVSGSRIDESDVLGIEVEADTQLAKRDWLRRIELRRAQGDTDGARESLRLFVRQYPRASIPQSLRSLLKE